MTRTPSSWLAIVAIAAGLQAGEAMANGRDNPIYDSVQEALFAEMPAVVDRIRESGHDNVGVLTFGLKKSEQADLGFREGMLCHKMADWVETCLILQADDLNILDNASHVAAEKLEAANYQRPDGRRKLFSVQYPLAWGNPPPEVEPHVFLTGMAQISDDVKTLSVAMIAIERDTIYQVAEFDVRTDRYLLADAGFGFGLDRKELNIPFSRGVDLDELIQGDIAEDIRESAPVATPPRPNPRVPDNSAGGGRGTPTDTVATPTNSISVRVLYDDQPQQVFQDRSQGSGNWQMMRDPGPGERVTFQLTNNTNQKLGVVLVVDGKNTLYEEYFDQGDVRSLSRWVLQPGKTYTIRGMYNSNRELTPLVGLSDDASDARQEQLGNLAGRIWLYVLESGSEIALNPKRPAEPEQMYSSLNRVSDEERKETRDGLRKKLEERMMLASRGLIGSGGSRQGTDLQQDALGNAFLRDFVEIRYWEPR